MTDTQTLEQKLSQINKRILKNEFIPCLAELAQLSLQNITNEKIWMLIGFAYTRMGIWSQAISALETSLKLKPGYTQAEHLLSLALFSIGRKQEACDLADKVVKKDSTSANWILRAYIHAHTNNDPAKTLETAMDWGRRFADPLTRKAKPLIVKNRDANKRLKIGYVTADFREHSVAFFMRPILENHDHENYEIHVFSNGPEDSTSAYFKTLVPHWLNVMEMTDDELCLKIRSLDIDVLVDLSGFTHGHRLGVFARRAAPVQVTYLGYLNTLGMKAMDYRLVDENIASRDSQKFYSENLFYLNTVATYSPPSYAPLYEDLPMNRNGYPTLVSLNSSAKITDAMLEVWSKILNLRPDAKLIIMVKEADAESAQADMLPRVTAANMPMDRVSVLHQQPLRSFMEMGHIADIMLDTSPISAGTTALHASWMGLRIVTLSGERGVDDSGAAAIKSLGLDGDIVYSKDEYVEKTLYLMNNKDLLLQHRLSARGKMQASQMMDYKSRTKDLELSYNRMWLNYLSGKKAYLDLL